MLRLKAKKNNMVNFILNIITDVLIDLNITKI